MLSFEVCFKSDLSLYVRYTFVACTHKMKGLMICWTNLFVNSETCFFGAWSKSVRVLLFKSAEWLAYDDNTVAQVPHLCSKIHQRTLELLLVYGSLLSYPIHDCDPIVSWCQQKIVGSTIEP